MLIEIVLPAICLLSPPVLAELRQADLITSEDCRRLSDISDVVRVQRGKSPEVVVRTADVLRRHEFVTVSKRLTGRRSTPSSVFLCYVAIQYPSTVNSMELSIVGVGVR